MNIEGFGNLEKNFEGSRTLASLNSADVIRVNVGLLGKGFLAQPRSFPIPEHCFTNDFAFRFSHWWLRKQKREKVTTHAPCRMVHFCSCVVGEDLLLIEHIGYADIFEAENQKPGKLQLTEENL